MMKYTGFPGGGGFHRRGGLPNLMTNRYFVAQNSKRIKIHTMLLIIYSPMPFLADTEISQFSDNILSM
jgi:hypothetical protein